MRFIPNKDGKSEEAGEVKELIKNRKLVKKTEVMEGSD